MTTITRESLAQVADTYRRGLVAEIAEREADAIAEAKRLVREGCPLVAAVALEDAAPALVELDVRLRRQDAAHREGWRPGRGLAAAGRQAVARDSLARQSGGES